LAILLGNALYDLLILDGEPSRSRHRVVYQERTKKTRAREAR
jgi:hypothetical protein